MVRLIHEELWYYQFCKKKVQEMVIMRWRKMKVCGKILLFAQALKIMKNNVSIFPLFYLSALSSSRKMPCEFILGKWLAYFWCELLSFFRDLLLFFLLLVLHLLLNILLPAFSIYVIAGSFFQTESSLWRHFILSFFCGSLGNSLMNWQWKSNP